MKDFEKLVRDYDEFEYNFDTYGYEDAVGDREEGFAIARKMLIDHEYREQTIERLEEIAEEFEEHAEEALGLAKRFRELKLTTSAKVSIVQKEDGFYIVFKGVELHRCPTLMDAKFICERFYTDEAEAEKTLALRMKGENR